MEATGVCHRKSCALLSRGPYSLQRIRTGGRWRTYAISKRNQGSCERRTANIRYSIQSKDTFSPKAGSFLFTGELDRKAHSPIHISNTVLSTVKLGPPQSPRTSFKDFRYNGCHIAPNHISKTVRPIVQNRPTSLSRPEISKDVVQIHTRRI